MLRRALAAVVIALVGCASTPPTDAAAVIRQAESALGSARTISFSGRGTGGTWFGAFALVRCSLSYSGHVADAAAVIAGAVAIYRYSFVLQKKQESTR